MRLKQLASQTDALTFSLLYHNPRFHTAEIATRYGIKQSRLSEFAHLMGVKTRREAGVIWKKPARLRVKPTARKPGSHGCNPDCPEWRRCRAGRLWVDGPLPCETMLDWETENEFDRDSLRTLWSIPLVVRVNPQGGLAKPCVEAMG